MFVKNYYTFLNESNDVPSDNVNKVYVRDSKPGDKNTFIKIGDVIRIYDISDNGKYRIENISNNKKYRLSTDSLSKYYKEITHENHVSNLLLTLLPDLKYVDLNIDYFKEDEKENISFIQKNRVGRIKDDPWESTQRTSIRIGRFLRRAYPLKDQSEIEKLTNRIKSVLRYDTDDIVEVKGEDIRFWYNCNNYTNENKGTLRKSCMRHSDFGYKFNIYVDNPDVCSLLIYLDSKRKLLSRALLWKLPDGTKYLDRVYFTNDEEIELFKRYALENNCLSYENGDNDEKLIIEDIVMDNDDKWEASSYPYMDTFMCIYPEENVISNKEDLGYGEYIYADEY